MEPRVEFRERFMSSSDEEDECVSRTFIVEAEVHAPMDRDDLLLNVENKTTKLNGRLSSFNNNTDEFEVTNSYNLESTNEILRTPNDNNKTMRKLTTEKQHYIADNTVSQNTSKEINNKRNNLSKRRDIKLKPLNIRTKYKRNKLNKSDGYVDLNLEDDATNDNNKKTATDLNKENVNSSYDTPDFTENTLNTNKSNKRKSTSSHKSRKFKPLKMETKSYSYADVCYWEDDDDPIVISNVHEGFFKMDFGNTLLTLKTKEKTKRRRENISYDSDSSIDNENNNNNSKGKFKKNKVTTETLKDLKICSESYNESDYTDTKSVIKKVKPYKTPDDYSPLF